MLAAAPLAAQERLHYQAPPTRVQMVNKAGEVAYPGIPSPGNNYDELVCDVTISVLDGRAYINADLSLTPERDDRITVPYVRLLDSNGVEFCLLTFTNAMFFSDGGRMNVSAHLPNLPATYLIACGYAYYCDTMYPHMQGGPQETVVDGASGAIVHRGPVRNRDTYGVEMSNESGLMFIGETLHARLTTTAVPASTSAVDRVDFSYAIFDIQSGKKLHSCDDVTDVMFIPKQPGNYLLSMRVGPAGLAYWRALRHIVVLPKLEWTDEPAYLGELAVNDSISCGTSNELHDTSDGRVDEALGGVLASDRLPGSRLTNLWGATGRVVIHDRGFFACSLGIDLKWNMPYLLDIEYPEDQPRSFALVIGNENYTPAFHTGHTMGQPGPRFFAEQTLFPLSKHVQHAQFIVWAGDDEVRNGLYVAIADPGLRADPFSGKPLVFTITLHQFVSIARLKLRSAFPVGLQRNVWVEQNGMLPNDNVRFSPHVNALVYGMNAIAPAMLFWNGHSDRNNTLMFPSARYRQPLRQVVNLAELQTDAFEDPSNRFNFARETCMVARQMGLGVFPRFEYGGSDDLPDDAHAVALDGKPYPPQRRSPTDRLVTDSVDVCHTAVLADACAVIAEMVNAVDENDRTALRRLIVRRRAQFLVTSYSAAALAQFERMTTNRLSGASLDAKRADLAARCPDAYRQWYQEQLLGFVAALGKAYQDLVPQPVEPCLYYHWRQSGMPFEGLYFQTVDSWTNKWAKIRHTPFEGFPLPTITAAGLVAAVTRWTEAEDGLDTALVPLASVRPVIPVYGETAARCGPYFDAFHTRSAAVKISPVLDPAAQVFRSRRRVLNAGATFSHVRHFSMIEPVLAFCEGDPIDLAFDQAHPPCFPYPAYARRFFANFLALPAVSMARVPQEGDARTLVVKTATCEGATYVAVINPGFSSVQAKVALPMAKASSIRPLVGPDIAVPFFMGAKGVSFSVALDALELRSFKVE